MGLVEGREAHEPVLAALGLEDSVSVLARDRERGGLQARFLARRGFEELSLEAAVGRPAEIHAEKHLGPVLGVRATGRRLDGDEGVSGVVFAGEERVLLQAFELGLERADTLLELVEL